MALNIRSVITWWRWQFKLVKYYFYYSWCPGIPQHLCRVQEWENDGQLCGLYIVDDDDSDPVWLISSSLSCSVRSENCEVLHLSSNMVAASLKQSGLITDRAYSKLTGDEDTLTRNALNFLWLLVQRSSSSYHLFIEAAQALCSRAMKSNKSHVRHTNNISEQNNTSGKTGKQQKQRTMAKENVENSEKTNLANGDVSNNSLLSHRGLIYSLLIFYSHFSFLALFHI